MHYVGAGQGLAAEPLAEEIADIGLVVGRPGATQASVVGNPAQAGRGWRPATIFYSRTGTCRPPWIKGLTIVVDSLHNRNSMGVVWLDK
jgi:hypothetical protein